MAAEEMRFLSRHLCQKRPVLSDIQAEKLLTHLVNVMSPFKAGVIVQDIESICAVYIWAVQSPSGPDYKKISRAARTIISEFEKDSAPPFRRGCWSDLVWDAKRLLPEIEKEAKAERKSSEELQARDSLVKAIFSSYPPGVAKKTNGSHFEETVRIVLAFIEKEKSSENIHKLILRSLKHK